MKVFLHFGLQKTGTTVFQQEIFNRFQGLTFYHRPSLRDLIDTIFLEEREKILISDESLFGMPPVGKNFEGEGDWLDRQVTCLRKIGDLEAGRESLEIFPMLSVRRHEHLLLSLYKQHLHQGGTMPLEGSFFDPKNDRGLIKQGQLLFEERIEVMRSHFTTEPFVFMKEELDDNFRGLMEDLADYLDEESLSMEKSDLKVWNRGVGEIQARVLRMLNRLLPHRYSPGPDSFASKLLRKLGLDPRTIAQDKLRFLGGGELERSDQFRDFIVDYYREDWEYTLEFIESTRANVDTGTYELPS